MSHKDIIPLRKHTAELTYLTFFKTKTNSTQISELKKRDTKYEMTVVFEALICAWEHPAHTHTHTHTHMSLLSA